MGGKPEGPKETTLQRTQADIATKWAELDDKTFKPLERRMVARSLDTEGDRSRALGGANTKFKQAFGATRPKVIASQIGSAGGGGRLLGAISDSVMDEGVATGLGLSDVNQAAEDDFTARRQALIDMGTGKAADASAGIGRAAKVAAEQSIADARASAASRAARNQLIGAGLGAAGAIGAGGLKSAVDEGLDTASTVTSFMR